MTDRSSAETGQALLDRGDRAGAIAAIDAGCSRNDSNSLFTAAIWSLVGDLLPRNLSLARQLLERARLGGHVDAAMMEVALTANGSGATADWARARALLEDTAQRDHGAAEHLALLQAMKLMPDGMPGKVPEPRQLSEAPFIALFPAALSPQECEHVARTVTDIIAPSMVVDPNTGRRTMHPIRQSDDAAIGPTRESLVVGSINRRIAAMTDTHFAQGEPLNVLRYAPGQQYRLHSDALPGVSNQRIITAITYLNHGFVGGETDFPAAGVRIKPRGGDVLVFHNTLPGGEADPRTRHAGLPVTNGVKWIATRWIRAAPYDPWNAAAN